MYTKETYTNATNPFVYSFLSGLFIILGACIIFAPLEILTYFVSDDAYYYLLTAKNIALGFGSTFDGVNYTNGYHPQWMLILLPIYFLIVDPITALKGVLFLQLAINLFSVFFVYSWHERRFDKSLAFASIGLLLLFFSPVVLMFNGLESSLLLFWLSLLLYLDDRIDFLSPHSNIKTRVLFGALLAGVATARLDTVFVLFGLVILKIVWPGAPRRGAYIFDLIVFYLPTIIAFIVVISPYFIWNYAYFDHLTPISGGIKNTFPKPLHVNRIGFQALPFILPFLVFCLYIVYSAFTKNTMLYKASISQWQSNTAYMLFFSFIIGCCLHLLWTRLFMFFGIYQWHFVMYIIPIVFFSTYLLQRLIAFSSLARTYTNPLIGIVFLLALTYNLLLSAEKGDHHASRLMAAEWVQANLDKNDGIALSDAGVFGYFNHRRTLNLDGLINSYEFQEAIQSGILPRYLSDIGINYIADAYTDCGSPEHNIYVYAWRGKNITNPTGYKFVMNPNTAVYRGEPKIFRPLTEDKRYCFTIWKLDDAVIKRFQL